MTYPGSFGRAGRTDREELVALMRQEPRYTTTCQEGGPLRDDIARMVDYWTRSAFVTRHAIRHLRARGYRGAAPEDEPDQVTATTYSQRLRAPEGAGALSEVVVTWPVEQPSHCDGVATRVGGGMGAAPVVWADGGGWVLRPARCGGCGTLVAPSAVTVVAAGYKGGVAVRA